jgi:hypothetical protein
MRFATRAGTTLSLSAWLLTNICHGQILLNGSFENQTTGGIYLWNNSLTINPIDANWTFSGSGVQLGAETGIRYHTPGDIADDGLWVAFVQTVGASIRQTVVFPTSGEFELRYSVAGRNTGPGDVGGDLYYQVSLENLGVIESGTTFSNQPWDRRSVRFHAEAGTAVFEVLATGIPGGWGPDQTLLLDRMSITPVPEPEEWTALAAATLLVGAIAIRRKSRTSQQS